MSKNSCRFFIPSNNCCCNINKIDENVFETHNQIGVTGPTGATGATGVTGTIGVTDPTFTNNCTRNHCCFWR